MNENVVWRLREEVEEEFKEAGRTGFLPLDVGNALEEAESLLRKYRSMKGWEEGYWGRAENILNRHPSLKVIFAHFYFISADIEAAERFLDAHRNVNLDLTPGIEMYGNFSKKLQGWREFSIKHQDRIFFGTDTVGGEKLNLKDLKIKMGVLDLLKRLRGSQK